MEIKSQTQMWLDKEFDQLYQTIGDPWGCLAGKNSFDNFLFLNLIKNNRPCYSNILDIGCGLGGLTNQLLNLWNTNGVGVVGFDVSKTAIDKAQETYPGVHFFEFDILKNQIENKMMGLFDLITMSEALWYVCEELSKTLCKIKNLLSQEGIFAIHQYFPDDQLYYKEYLNGLNDFESKMEMHKWSLIKKVISYNEQGQVLLALYKPIS